MRAYRAADINGDGLIKRREFHLLIEYLVYFTDLWDVFDEIDSNHDRRLSHHEFVAGCEKLGIVSSQATCRLVISGSILTGCLCFQFATEEELEQEFVTMDMRDGGGGFILFDEFSKWCARRQLVARHAVHDDPTVVTSATPPGVSQARDRLQAVLNDEHHPQAYDIEALRQAFAMYCESSSSVGKTKWMTNPKFMRMMRDSGVIRTRPKPAGGDKSGGAAGGDKFSAASAVRSLGHAGLPKAQIDVIFAKALRIGKQRDGKGPPNMVNGKTLGFDGFVCALHSLAVQLFFPGADLHSLSQESIKSAHRRLVVSHIFPATLPSMQPATDANGTVINNNASTSGYPMPVSPERFSIEDTLNPEDEKEQEVRASKFTHAMPRLLVISG